MKTGCHSWHEWLARVPRGLRTPNAAHASGGVPPATCRVPRALFVARASNRLPAPGLRYAASVFRGTGILPVACGNPQASVVLDRHKQKRSALYLASERVALAIAYIDGLPSIGAEYSTSRARRPCH